jgi:hypothetical protein
VAELVQSLGALSLSPLQVRSLDAELKKRTALVKQQLGDVAR